MKLAATLAAAGLIAVAAIGLRELGVFGNESFEGGIDPPSLQLDRRRDRHRSAPCGA